MSTDIDLFWELGKAVWGRAERKMMSCAKQGRASWSKCRVSSTIIGTHSFGAEPRSGQNMPISDDH
eukprot:280782-Amphidinium_carterae.1